MTYLTLEDFKTAGLLLLASIGGALGFIRKELAMGRKITFFRTFFAVCLAAFLAYLMKVACRKLGVDDDWTKIIIGVVCFLGPDFTIQILERIVLKRLGIGYGYFPIDSAEKVPNTIGSTDYLRADVFDTPVAAREQATAVANNNSNGGDQNTAGVTK